MKAFFVSLVFYGLTSSIRDVWGQEEGWEQWIHIPAMGYVGGRWPTVGGGDYGMALPTHTLVFFFMLSYFGVIFVKILPK